MLINKVGARNHWIGLRVIDSGGARGAAGAVGDRAGRDMLGARVAVLRPDRPALWRRAHSDGSYGSANDPRVLVGLGASTEAVRVRVLWPDGATEEWTDISVDRYTTLKEGTGR